MHARCAPRGTERRECGRDHQHDRDAGEGERVERFDVVEHRSQPSAHQHGEYEAEGCAGGDQARGSIASRSGSGSGSGRNSVASASAKIALLAPMPSASVRMATAAKPA